MSRTAGQLDGVVPIVPTPFTRDEAIDFAALARCVEFAAAAGLSTVCLPAYASEFYKLTAAERAAVVEAAIGAAGGRIAVMAQANHPSAKIAAETARRYEALGASFISFALPRIFALPEDDLLVYAETICRATSLPILIQDFNPGGPTVGASFARRLAERCENFRYLKLEEPLMGPKIRAIREATAERVGVLEGWGGMYVLDLIPAGICGLMPGLAVADLLERVWRLAKAGQTDDAYCVFQAVLPQVAFALQSSEFFNFVEKRLLAARGVIPASAVYVRQATATPDRAALDHGDWLGAKAIAMARQLGLPSL